ncbi:MAG: TldD/PmbA family protein [Chthoniobacterales bacterium]|nr:TldD/PmbA family protein [Chthoniobacterales bacterium]
MAQFSESEAQAILAKVIGFSKADECEATLTGGKSGNLRFARNAVSTSGGKELASLEVQSSFGKKTGTATLNEFDDASLEKVVRRAEEMAQLAPENPEYVEFLGSQEYLSPSAYFESTAAIDPAARARHAAASIKVCKDRKLEAAGFLQDDAGFTAVANSRGLKGYHRTSGIDFSVTVRTPDGKGSGYGICDYNDAKKLDTASISRVAADKAARSRETRAIEPGKYTVILEPAASVDLISHMINALDARQAEEGRSFMSKPGGETRRGEKLLDERVHIYSDPMNPDAPGSRWADDGRPRRPLDWIKGGTVANLAYSRYWALKKGLDEDQAPPPVGGGFGGGAGNRSVAAFEGNSGILMEGGNASLEELIKGVKRGVLVTRLWYIRPVDPQTLLYTGLTRDGTFYVENGEIKYAVKNFRFNESPVIMLNNLEALGKPTRVNGNMIPPMVVRDFTFSSLSEAV